MLMIHSSYFFDAKENLLVGSKWCGGNRWKRVEMMDLTQKGKGLIAFFKDRCVEKEGKHEVAEPAAWF